MKEDGPVEVKSKKGNVIKKKGEPGNPAVAISRSGNDVVKKASELDIEKKASGGGKKRKAEDKGKEKEDVATGLEASRGHIIGVGGGVSRGGVRKEESLWSCLEAQKKTQKEKKKKRKEEGGVWKN